MINKKRGAVTSRRRCAPPTRADENGHDLTDLARWKQIPSESEAGHQLVLLKARVGNWSVARLLEQATVVSAQRMNTYGNVLNRSQAPFAPDLNDLPAPEVVFP